jgi:hypothetical protein
MIHDLSESLRKIMDAPKEASDMAALYENGEPSKMSLQDAKTPLENFGTALDKVASLYPQSDQSNKLRALIDDLGNGREPQAADGLARQKIDDFKQACVALEAVFSAPDAPPPIRKERVLRFAAFMIAFWELRKATISLQRLSDIKPETNNTVSLFLYDIKENMELRNNEPQVRRGNGQVSIVRAPLRLACSYLITAWTAGDQEYSLLLEHQLLSQALQLLSRHHFLPRYFLQGSLQAQEPLPPLATLQAESLKNASEFWTAAQQKLRPALNVLATISMQPFEAQAERLVTKPPEIDFSLPPPPNIEGRILRDGQPLARALVSLVEADETTATDFKGRYSFKAAQTSKAYTLRIRVSDASGFVVETVQISTREKRDKDSTTPYLQVRLVNDKGGPVTDGVVTAVELGPGKPVDAAGMAEFFRVPPRTYALRIESQNIVLETNVIVPKARTQ